MKNAIQLLFTAYLSLLLAGCATKNAPISQDASQRIKRLAIVSVTAQVFTRKYTGVTVFGNEKDEQDISGWQVDSQYEDQIAAEITRIRGVPPVRAPYQVADFIPVNKMPAVYLTSMYDGANWEAIEISTKAYCAKHTLDAVLVVAQTSVPDFFTGTNQHLNGAGFYVRGPIRGVSVLHLMSKLALLDCQNGKPLAVRTLARNQHPGFRSGMLSAPYQNVSEKLSRLPTTTWTPEAQQQIRADLIQLPMQSWGPTLQSLFKP